MEELFLYQALKKVRNSTRKRVRVQTLTKEQGKKKKQRSKDNRSGEISGEISQRKMDPTLGSRKRCSHLGEGGTDRRRKPKCSKEKTELASKM